MCYYNLIIIRNKCKYRRSGVSIINRAHQSPNVLHLDPPPPSPIILDLGAPLNRWTTANKQTWSMVVWPFEKAIPEQSDIHYVMVSCNMLWHHAPHYVVMHYIMVSCTKLLWHALYYSVMHYIIVSCTTLGFIYETTNATWTGFAILVFEHQANFKTNSKLLCCYSNSLAVTGECYDRSTECRKWAFEGRCISHSKMMKNKCPYSCEYCQLALCINTDSNCERWAEAQACHIFPKLMGKKCKLACGYCSTSTRLSSATVRQPWCDNLLIPSCQPISCLPLFLCGAGL